MEEESSISHLVPEDPEEIQVSTDDAMQVSEERESVSATPSEPGATGQVNEDGEMSDIEIYEEYVETELGKLDNNTTDGHDQIGMESPGRESVVVEEYSDVEHEPSPPHAVADFVDDSVQQSEVPGDTRASSEGSIVVEEVVDVEQGHPSDEDADGQDNSLDELDNIVDSEDLEYSDGSAASDKDDPAAEALSESTTQVDPQLKPEAAVDTTSEIGVVDVEVERRDFVIGRNGELEELVPDHAQITELPDSPPSSSAQATSTSAEPEVEAVGLSSVELDGTTTATATVPEVSEIPVVSEPLGAATPGDEHIADGNPNPIVEDVNLKEIEVAGDPDAANPVADSQVLDDNAKSQSVTVDDIEDGKLQEVETNGEPDVPIKVANPDVEAALASETGNLLTDVVEAVAPDAPGDENTATADVDDSHSPSKDLDTDLPVAESNDEDVDADADDGDLSDDYKNQLESTPVFINYLEESYPLLGKLIAESPTNPITLEELIDIIRRQVPSLPPDRELILYIEPLGLRIGEDNLYTREATLNDLILLLPTVKSGKGKEINGLQISVECAERFISQLNSLFAELASMPPQKRARQN